MASDKQQAELDRVTDIVQKHLESGGLEPDQVKMKTADKHPAWAFRQGSASVRIHLLPGDKESDYGYFQVVAPVIILPESEREQVFQRLLELNADQLWSCAFAIRQDRVIITADRTTRDLDGSEVVEMIERVAAYADKFDDELVEEFGGTRYTDRPIGNPS
jgi:cytochrome c1